MAVGDILNYGFLYKQGSNWTACKNATPVVNTLANGRVGSFYDGFYYTIGRMYLCVDTNYTEEFLNTYATFYIRLNFNVWSLSPDTTCTFVLLTQYWGPSLNSSAWVNQADSGYYDTDYSTTNVNYLSLDKVVGNQVFHGGFIYSNTYSLGSKGIVTSRHKDTIFSDNKTYYTMWLRNETLYTPSSSIKNRGIYVNATPIVETDTSDNYQYQTKQWFISSDLKGIGSASVGLHTTNLLKTNNKYGTR